MRSIFHTVKSTSGPTPCRTQERSKKGFVQFDSRVLCGVWTVQTGIGTVSRKALQGIMVGKDRKQKLRMKFVCDLNLRICHCESGFLGSMNDLNILAVSPFMGDILRVDYPPFMMKYKINGDECDWM